MAKNEVKKKSPMGKLNSYARIIKKIKVKIIAKLKNAPFRVNNTSPHSRVNIVKPSGFFFHFV
jgi:hypothetical protein